MQPIRAGTRTTSIRFMKLTNYLTIRWQRATNLQVFIYPFLNQSKVDIEKSHAELLIFVSNSIQNIYTQLNVIFFSLIYTKS